MIIEVFMILDGDTSINVNNQEDLWRWHWTDLRKEFFGSLFWFDIFVFKSIISISS
jgi:hypothetical protein